MRQKGLFLVATLSWGCADLIGLNGLDDGAADAHSGGGTADGTGGSGDGSMTGSSGGGDAAAGGASGGSAGSGGNSNAGGAEPSGGASSGGGGGGTSSGGGGGTPSGGGGGLPDACTDDEFLNEQVTESCWSIFNTNVLTGGGERGYSWETGVITLRPEEERGWRDGDAGFLMYQEISGNFLIEVHGKIEDLAEDLPTTPEVYGGLLLMPTSVDLEATPHTAYYAVKYGILSNGSPGYLGEYASDTPGTTVATPDDQQPITGAGVYLRMCRVGDFLWVGAKLGDVAPWTPLHANGSAFYDTTDTDLTPLGETVRVGLLGEMVGTGSSGSVRILYDDTEIRISEPDPPPTSVDNCGDVSVK